MPRVTVGIPFRNAENTIGVAIRSALVQTYTDIEVLAVDDGSSDQSVAIARSIQDDRITVISDGNSLGLAARLNQIAELARGDYVARMDADDIMHRDRIAVQVQYLDSREHIEVVSTAAYAVDSALNVLGIRPRLLPDMSRCSLCLSNPIVHPTVMMRIGWAHENPYSTEFNRSEDHELWLRSCAHSQFGFIAVPLLFYREARAIIPAKYAATASSDRRLLREYCFDCWGRGRIRMLEMTSRLKVGAYHVVHRLGLSSYYFSRTRRVGGGVVARGNAELHNTVSYIRRLS